MSDREVVRFAPKDRGVNRAIKGVHAIVPLGARALEPVDRAIRSGNEAVGTGRDLHDEFAFAWHSRLRRTSYRAPFF